MAMGLNIRDLKLKFIKFKSIVICSYHLQNEPMTHDHHSHSHNHYHGLASERLKTALWLNIVFTLIEVIGGLWTGSVAILADAVHDLGDSLALGLAVVLEKKSNQGPNAHFSYGYKRFSLLSAWSTGVVLVVGSIVVGVESTRRLISGEFEPHGQG
jgi:cobalt-zinc-cadmium efflux system protein